MNAQEYAALYEQEEKMWWFVGMRRIVTTLLGDRARTGGLRCLDAGCGTGYNTLDFTKRFGWEVFPCDQSPDALAFSASRGVQKLVRADVSSLPYASSSFDGITSFDVLMMLQRERCQMALAEFHRVLRPGGFLLVRLPALELLRGFHSEFIQELHRYSLSEFSKMLDAAGFRIERSTYANSLLFPLALLKRRVLEPLRIVPFESEVRPIRPMLDKVFRAALAVENQIFKAGARFPFGVSVCVVATSVSRVS